MIKRTEEFEESPLLNQEVKAGEVIAMSTFLKIGDNTERDGRRILAVKDGVVKQFRDTLMVLSADDPPKIELGTQVIGIAEEFMPHFHDLQY